MKRLIVDVILGVVFILGCSQSNENLKVFISVDMEGVAGVVHWEDVSRSGKDYDLFRELMTLEANAAIEVPLQLELHKYWSVMLMEVPEISCRTCSIKEPDFFVIGAIQNGK